MPTDTVLITGFDPFGGDGINPSGEVARAMDGSTIGNLRVVGRVLPVDLAVVPGALDQLVRDVDPAIVVNLGLAPGEPAIRLERVAINVADFEIPDNTGRVLRDADLDGSGPLALGSRLPVRKIEAALLAGGIPARISNTAGLFLCNATMYTVLRNYPDIPAGFVHLPYLPKEVATLLAQAQKERSINSHRPASLASMSLSVMIDAVRIIVQTTVAAGGSNEESGELTTASVSSAD